MEPEMQSSGVWTRGEIGSSVMDRVNNFYSRPTEKIGWACGLLVNLALVAGCYDDSKHEQTELRVPKDFIAIEEGRSWTYKVTVAKNTRIFDCKCEGGDVRTLDGIQTRYQFVYGRTEGFDGYVTKSIYAMAESGPREFFIDDFSGGFLHDPPVQLLPKKIEVGATWSWNGQFARGDKKITGTAQLEITSIEQNDFGGDWLDVVRVRESFDNSPIRITRCFARDVGLVSYLVTEQDDRGQLKAIATMELEH